MSSLNNLESAQELLEHNTSNESINITIGNIQRYIKKSKIKNAELTLNDKNQLEQELCEFFVNMKRQDGKLYKPESIISAYTSLRRYILKKIMELQDQGLGKINQSKGLTAEEIYQILLYLESGEQTTLKLTWKAFFWNAYLLGLRGSDYYQLLSRRRTSIQLLLDLNVNEHEMIQFSGHCSTDELQFLIVQQRESEQEESQVMQQDESQVMQQEESQKFQVIQPDKSQAIQYEESQVMQHDVQIIQHKEFQTTQQVTQDNSSVMQHEFNSTATQ
ncbi:14807_t:CDS:2, partial [Gigaspora margarita]